MSNAKQPDIRQSLDTRVSSIQVQLGAVSHQILVLKDQLSAHEKERDKLNAALFELQELQQVSGDVVKPD